MPTFTVQEAEAQLPKLLAQARAGEDVIIAEGEHPIARLIPVPDGLRRRPGALKGRISLTSAFFEALPADEIMAWGEDS